jgi:SH3-like domain-containing protein
MKPMCYLACMAIAALVMATAGMAQELRPQVRPDTATVVEPATEPAPELIAALPEPMPEGPVLGPETNLPLPRYVSLKTDEGNVRRGPSMSHRIDWVFRREDMPLQIVAEYGHWRRVVDSDGVGGWMNYAMLSGNRTVLVQTDMQPVYGRPDLDAPQNAVLEQGVVADLGECQPDWCWISAGGYRGWAPKSALWGVDAAEVRD